MTSIMRIQQKDFDYTRPGFYMAMEKYTDSFMISSCVIGEGGLWRKRQEPVLKHQLYSRRRLSYDR